MRWLVVFALFACATACTSPPAPPALPAPPAPTTVDEFKTAVQRVLDETGVPGAGIALVRTSGVEWAGGIGFADRDRQTPVTADTHFRAGSISKTFIAMAVVQLYEAGDIDIESPVTNILTKIDLENPWQETDPVRIIHLLQHTAGFDDMHFNEMYNLSDPADMPLEEVLRINPRSRRVRWRPGTRWSYSNPGYTVAAYLLEEVTGERFENVIAEKIFQPVGMTTSSFILTKEDEKLLAKGYRSRQGPPVPYSQIYLRPSGNLHTSAAELGKFVQLLLNWGETTEELVVDPEYLSNMEHPKTTLASRAGLRNGYGSGIGSLLTEPFPLLGHGGGIEGFVSQYAYSTSRDCGFVVLLNASYSRPALDRISNLAIRYLKRDVDPPEKPRAAVPAAMLMTYEGYYHPASPRRQATAFLEWLLAGQTIRVDGDALAVVPALYGPGHRLIPTADNLFRLENEVDASRVFAADEQGQMVMAGLGYDERIPRWQVEIVRWPVLASAAIVLTPLLVVVIWLARIRISDPGFWWLKIALLLCAAGLAVPIVAIANVQESQLGLVNLVTVAMFAGTLLLPAAALLALASTIHAWINDASAWLGTYAFTVTLAAIILSAYLISWGMIGFRPWAF